MVCCSLSHRRQVEQSWQKWVRQTFERGAGPAHRASRARTLEAAVGHADQAQPCQLADREIDTW
eukprot:9226310-Pyramimonas_sp.AAC.1